jgi:hypothetical protein
MLSFAWVKLTNCDIEALWLELYVGILNANRDGKGFQPSDPTVGGNTSATVDSALLVAGHNKVLDCEGWRKATSSSTRRQDLSSLTRGSQKRNLADAGTCLTACGCLMKPVRFTPASFDMFYSLI